MPAFVDNMGRTWTVSITYGTIRRVRELLGINLAEPQQGEPPLLTRLGTDVMLLCDVIFALIRPQAEQQGVDDEQWAAAMGGEAILAAHDAFYEALEAFFRDAGRLDLAKAVRKQLTMIQLSVKASERRVERFDPESEVEQIFGDWDTSSQQSPE